MALTRPSGDFQSSSLNGALAAAATTATIGTGLTIPATNSYLQLDYDSTTAINADNGPETVFYATYTTGTGALTGLVRGQAGTTDHAHANGAKVQCGMTTKFLEGFVGARAYLDSAQDNLTYAQQIKVLLDAETYDVGGNFASNKFVAPVNGYYDIRGQIGYVNAVANYIYAASIYVNGALVAYHYDSLYNTNLIARPSVSDVRYLAKDDYVELFAYNTSAVNTIDLEHDTEVTYLAIHLVKEV